MENKYYTPELEEFHIGMEIELYRDEKWNKSIVDLAPFDLGIAISYGDFSSIINASNFKSDELRVKYLDSSDILSFGFFHATGSSFVTSYGKRHHNDHKHPNLGYVLHDNHAKETITIIQSLTNGEPVTLFDGTIKNKSELKKLLKQLGI